MGEKLQLAFSPFYRRFHEEKSLLWSSSFLVCMWDHCINTADGFRKRLITEIETLQQSFTHCSFCRCDTYNGAFVQATSNPTWDDSLEFRRKIALLATVHKLSSNKISVSVSALFKVSGRIDIIREHLYRIRPDKPNSAVQKLFPCMKRSSRDLLWNVLQNGYAFQAHLAQIVRWIFWLHGSLLPSITNHKFIRSNVDHHNHDIKDFCAHAVIEILPCWMNGDRLLVLCGSLFPAENWVTYLSSSMLSNVIVTVNAYRDIKRKNNSYCR